MQETLEVGSNGYIIESNRTIINVVVIAKHGEFYGNRLKTRRLYPHTFFCYTDSIQKYSEGGFSIYGNIKTGTVEIQTYRLGEQRHRYLFLV